MSLAGGRQIECATGAYKWIVRRRGHDFRLVVQDPARRGQLLIARFPVYVLCEANEARGDYFLRTRISPTLLRDFVADGLRAGWRPGLKGAAPFRLGSPAGGSPWAEGVGGIACVDGLWSLLDAICRDPSWREGLARNTGEFVPVPPAYIRGVDPELEGRVAAAGRLAIHVRPRDSHGDATPHLAIRSLTRGRDIVLEEISNWHTGWRRA